MEEAERGMSPPLTHHSLPPRPLSQPRKALIQCERAPADLAQSNAIQDAEVQSLRAEQRRSDLARTKVFTSRVVEERGKAAERKVRLERVSVCVCVCVCVCVL
jgi:hypothetical protein